MLTKEQRKYLAALEFARNFRRANPALAAHALIVGGIERNREWRNNNREYVRKYNREYMAKRRATMKGEA